MTGKETLAKTLGYAGLIPFVIFSVGCWIPLPYVTNAADILIAYGAIILSFMGAIHWGIALSDAVEEQGQYLVASVTPALLGWLSLLLPQTWALIILLAGFVGLFVYDRAVEQAQSLPTWYLPMRLNLTVVVAICLLSALIAQ